MEWSTLRQKSTSFSRGPSWTRALLLRIRQQTAGEMTLQRS